MTGEDDSRSPDAPSSDASPADAPLADASPSDASSPDLSAPDVPSSIESDESPSGIAIRPADADEYVDVMRILEGALLDVDGDEVRSRIDAGDVLVAVETADSSRGDSDFESSSGSGSGSEFGSSSGSSSGSGPVIAAIVLVPRDSRIHIEAVAVRRSRRGRGIGSALVRAGLRHAEDRGFDRVTAGFDRDLREFYADMGFSIGAIDCSSDDCSSDDFPSDDSPSDDSPSDDQLLGMVAVEPASDDRSPSP